MAGRPRELASGGLEGVEAGLSERAARVVADGLAVQHKWHGHASVRP